MNNKFTHLIQLDFAITTVVKQVEGFLELCKFEKKINVRLLKFN